MIPVLGVPVLNRPDLLYAMLNSTNVEIERVVIVDNGDVVPEITNKNVRIIQPGHNLGVAASWNLIIKSTPVSPWWLFSNSDIEFAGDDLSRIAEYMNGGGEAAVLGTYSVLAVSALTMEKVGWFDENFAPAYFEDNDFDYRCRLAGVEVAALPCSYVHHISSTIRSSPSYKTQNDLGTFPANGLYYMDKWGGLPTDEKFTTPFNNGGDHRTWHVDLSRLARQAWRVDRPEEGDQ